MCSTQSKPLSSCIGQLKALKRGFIYNIIYMYSSRKKSFRHLFIFTIKYLTNTDAPARLAHLFCVFRQYFEEERPKGNYLEVVVHLYGLGAKLIYMGYFVSLLHPLGRKTWLLFSVRDMSWGLRNPRFTKFSVVSFL